MIQYHLKATINYNGEMNMKVLENISLKDKAKNFVRAINPITGKVLFERENIVTQRGRLFVLEKTFNDYYTSGDNAASMFNLKYYVTMTEPEKVIYLGNTENIYMLESGSYVLKNATTVPTRTAALAPGAYTTYRFISLDEFNDRMLMLYKVGNGGVADDIFAPVAPRATDSDLRNTVNMRIINIPTVSDLDTYCCSSIIGAFTVFTGKYFDDTDPVWVIDVNNNIIAKKIEMTLNTRDLRDFLNSTNTAIINKATTEAFGVLTPYSESVICTPHTVGVVYPGGTKVQLEIAGIKYPYWIEYQNGAGGSVYVLTEMVDPLPTDMDDIPMYQSDGLTLICNVDIRQNINTAGLVQNSTVKYEVAGSISPYVIYSQTADIDSTGFTVATAITSTEFTPITGGVVLYDSTDKPIGYVTQDMRFDHNVMFNELGLYFAKRGTDGRAENGTEELFSRITFSSKTLEANEEVKFEYYVFA